MGSWKNKRLDEEKLAAEKKQLDNERNAAAEKNAE